MANEKRMIDANAYPCQTCEVSYCYKNCKKFNEWLNKTVDAVEVDDMREFAKDVAYQFGYYCQNGGRLHITHGGLSTLEWAFDILGWENPHPVPECECEIDGCHEHATCGANTADGYKRMCGKHCRERRTE
jgi:hypothetical protein